jgi:hypothetical protein
MCGRSQSLTPEDTIGRPWNEQIELYDNIKVLDDIETDWWWSRTQGSDGYNESIRDINPHTMQNVVVIRSERLETCHPSHEEALGVEITIDPVRHSRERELETQPRRSISIQIVMTY